MRDLPSFERALAEAAARDANVKKAVERIREPFPLASFELRVRTLFETRELAFDTCPTETTVDLRDDPNPWEVEIDHPEGAGEGSSVELRYDLEYPRVCTACSGVGDALCPECRGSHSSNSSNGNESKPCRRCGGAGRIACTECAYSGVVRVVPRAVSRLAASEHRRATLLDARATLPDEVFLAFQDEVRGLVWVFEETGARVDEPMLARLRTALANAGVTHTEPAVEIARRQGAHPDIGAARIKSQTLRLGRIPLWSLTIDGVPAHALGDPVAIYPPALIHGARWKRALFFGVFVALVLAGVATFLR